MIKCYGRLDGLLEVVVTMESLIFGLSILFVGFMLLTVLVFLMGCMLLIPSYISNLIYLYNERKKASWQSLTTDYELRFVPGDSWTGAFVTGTYKGHHLTLDTFPKNPSKSSRTTTRIFLAAKSTGGHLSSKKEGAVEQITIEKAVKVLTPGDHLKGEFKAESNGRQISYKQYGVETDVKYLQFVFDLLVELTDVYRVVELGGEAVPALAALATDKNNKLRPIVIEMLKDIAQATTARLGDWTSQLVCRHCMVRCSAHQIRLSRRNLITYYGCRMCSQSERFFSVKSVVAILDSGMRTEWSEQNNTLTVNGLTQQMLFDFDTVMIVQATDEQVERFAVRVGNDTDPTRQPCYKTMLCRVSSECKLSANTLRILEQIFGRVELVNPRTAVQKTTADEGTFQALDGDHETREMSRADQDWDLGDRKLSKVDEDRYDSTGQ